jgi:hypothetical protein
VATDNSGGITVYRAGLIMAGLWTILTKITIKEGPCKDIKQMSDEGNCMSYP